MIAGVSLERAVEAVDVEDEDEGTETIDIRRGLGELGIACAPRMKRLSRKKPVLPKRCMIYIRSRSRAVVNKKVHRKHWLLSWDGVIYDPGDYEDGIYKPENYPDWEMVSVLEIYERI